MRGLDADQLADAQLGVYSRGEVEAVVTAASADEANLEVGNRIVVGAERETTAIVHIVGIVEPTLPADNPFWEGIRIVLTGQYVPRPDNPLFERYDLGLIVPEGAYDDWLADTTTANTYEWRLTLNPDVVHADTLDELDSRLATVQSSLRARYPDMIVLSGLADLIANFRRGLRSTEGPIVLLSGAVLILMLYHLVTTVALVLEQQGNEWATITSRGGSLSQLLGMQGLTMGLLGLIGFVTGPFIAQGILLILEKVGPLARTLNGAGLGVRTLPPSIFVLSGVAAVAAIVVLTLPAWPAARRSLLRLKQLISRPPTRPAWARYYLDAILLVIGLAFMLRLYFMISGDVGSSLDALLHDPASLIRLIASGANDVGGLNDPFNLFGPALVLTGAALLWLRVFPLLMRLFGWLFRASAGLTAPLALWSVERDPGHYAQLVLLLIGTLALGTASLTLSATRDVGAWAVAQQETGGQVRLEFDPRAAGDPQSWLALPDVTGGQPLLVAKTPTRAGQADTTLIGVDPVAFGAAFPDLAGVLAPLQASPPVEMPGIVLPEDAAALSVQVYAEASDEPTETRLSAELVDAIGVPATVPFETVDATDSGRFVAYTAALPTSAGQAPWRLTGIRIQSQRGDLQDFSHAIVLDDLVTLDAEEQPTPVEGFEAGPPAGWSAVRIGFQRQEDLSLAASTDLVASGAGALRVEYRVRWLGGSLSEPSIAIQPVGPQVLPVVMSRSAAAFLGARTAARRDLVVGDEDSVELNMPYGTVELRYRVAGLVDTFPTQSPRALFAVVQGDNLRAVLNRTASLNGYYDINQAWLTLDQREAPEAFRAAAAGLPGLQSATYAWDRYNEIQREPLPNSITGMLFAGFWVSLALSVLDFGFYLAVTARRRAVSFAVLQAIGWETRNVWSLLAVEQAALVTPALIVGVGLGAVLAYLLLPFLELIGGEALRFPVGDVLFLLVALVIMFVLLLVITALFLRRQAVHQMLRMGEE